MPATTNQIESTNARLRQMLRDYRGMRLTRRMKAVFWWCYTHSTNSTTPPPTTTPGTNPSTNTFCPITQSYGQTFPDDFPTPP